MATTLERIVKTLVDSFGLPHSELVATAHFSDDLGLDAIDQVEMLMAIEELFDIEIDDDAADKATTVGELAALVDTLTTEARVDEQTTADHEEDPWI